MKLYRGNDRRLLAKTKKVLELIAARDTRALNPKKTAALSNRVQIFSALDTDMTDAVALITARIQNRLDASA